MSKHILSSMISFLMVFFVLLSLSHAYTPGSVQVTVKDFYSEALLSGATVTMEPGGYSDSTDISGVVTFTDIIPYRNYAVAVSLDGYIEGVHGEGRTGFVWVKTGQMTSVTIPIKKESSIEGRITSGSTPLPDTLVLLTRPPLVSGYMGDDEEFVAAILTDSNGDYIFPSVAEGDYSIRAFADSHVASSSEQVTIDTDEALTRNFSLTPGVPTLSYSIQNLRNYYGKSVRFVFSITPDQYNERVLIVSDAPLGAEVLDITNDGLIFTPTLGGNYTVAAAITDFNDVVRTESDTFEMVNQCFLCDGFHYIRHCVRSELLKSFSPFSQATTSKYFSYSLP